MLIPVRTDATVYYRAYATFAIMAANILLFFLIDPTDNPTLWILEFGTLKPWQWITSSFSHGGLLHLGGNMLFLFWFGQIVEGKIGSGRFLLVYLGIAAVSGLLTQILMLGADEGGAIGASDVIYGLIVIALIIEREATITCVILLGIFLIAKPFEVRLRSFAIFYLAWNLFWAMVFGFEIGTEVLHLIGAAGGLLAAGLIRAADWAYDPERHPVCVRVTSNRPRPTPAPTPPPRKREDLPPLEL